MIFKNSVSIFLNNLTLIYKLLIFMMIVLLIATALFIGIISPALEEIFAETETTNLIGTYELIELEGMTYSNLFGAMLRDFRAFLNNNRQVIYNSLIWVCVVYIIAKFFFSLSAVPIAKVINDKMSSNFNNGFLQTFIQYFKQSVGYAFFSSIMFVPLDLIVTLGVVALGIQLYSVVNILSIAFSLSLILLYAAFRMSMFCQWLPYIIEGNSTLKAFTKAFKPSVKSLKDIYPSTLFILVLIVWATGTGLNLITFGIVPIFMIPFMTVFLNILYMVNFYNVNKKKYYIDKSRIEDPESYL